LVVDFPGANKLSFMNTFQESGLREDIIKAIGELGFEKPTPIQEQTIPFILNSEMDIIALAQTGTGKTAAFGLPVIHHIEEHDKKVQALVLCPTRELCMQITNDLTLFSKYIKGLYVVPVYGGSSIDKQISALVRGGQIVVGTPGRVLDLVKRKKLRLETIKYLVLDEADEMLNMGFKEDLDAILSQTPEGRQSMLFSATMPKEIASLAKRYMQNAKEISVGKKNAGAENVQHHYYVVQASNRYLALKRIMDFYPNIYGIVFCRTRQETKDVAEKLMQDDYNADALHGDLSQAQRDYVMSRFRNKSLHMLVATDVAARGLDVNDLTHIINYNLPDELDAYIHRSGRTGRAGKHGVSVTIIHGRETNKIAQLEKKVGKQFEHKKVPNGEEVCEKQLFHLIDKVEWVEIDESTIETYLDIINKKLAWLSREELIKRFVSVEFNRFLSYYKNAPDLNVSASKPREKQERNKRRSDVNFTRFHINLGSRDRLSVVDLISLINKNTGDQSIEIGKIEILKKFSFFELDKSHEMSIIEGFKNVTRDGVEVKIEVSREKPGDSENRRSERKSDSFRPEKRKSERSRPERGRSEKKSSGRGKGGWDKPGFGKKKDSSKGKKKYR
jgi:ATP-dependent RNA helicase DeaD